MWHEAQKASVEVLSTTTLPENMSRLASNTPDSNIIRSLYFPLNAIVGQPKKVKNTHDFNVSPDPEPVFKPTAA